MQSVRGNSFARLAGLGLAMTLATVPAASSTAAPAKPAMAKKAAKKVKQAAKQAVKKPRAIFDTDYATTAQAKYGAMTKDECLTEANARGLPIKPVAEARGVLAPVRLTGDIGGVSYHTELPQKDRAQSPFEVFDCRLVLALDDFGSVLRAHNIDEALIFSAWRPPSKKSWPDGKLGTRHPGALAVDIRVFVKHVGGAKDSDLVVLRDWTPAIDKDACGASASPVSPDTAAAKEIRSIYCEAAGQRIFTSQLGPNYNKAHDNHFHMEITPNVKWRLVL